MSHILFEQSRCIVRWSPADLLCILEVSSEMSLGLLERDELINLYIHSFIIAIAIKFPCSQVSSTQPRSLPLSRLPAQLSCPSPAAYAP